MLTTVALAVATRYAIIPEPKILIPQPDEFRIDTNTILACDKSFAKVGESFRTSLLKSTGIELKQTGAGSRAIRIVKDANLKTAGEGYKLFIDDREIEIRAKTPAGAFYGVQSLKQLMPVATWGAKAQATSIKVPGVIIEDEPRFSWRGSHLDTGRHFMPTEFIKKYIDLLAMHKLNVFHWHLTEDQGWRLEIKKYPKLTSVGSIRKRSMLKYSPAAYEEKEYGGFYTQADAKEIVKYAAERFITVVPEIEMPGHSQAAIAAYPELGNTKDKVEVADKWGVISRVFNPELSTIKFLQDVLDEVMTIFPSKFIHIGGDECPKDEWKASPRVQQLIKERGLKDEHEMQSWFVRQMDQYLAKKGRRLIGWDEILEGGLAPGAAVMSWRGEAGGIEAAKAKHDVVMASTNALYFDYYQGDPKTEPHAIGGFLNLQKVYEYDILPKELNPEETKHIIGGQFQIWTEYIRTPSYAEYMAFPRGSAAAEIFWSPKSKRNFANFARRMEVHMERFAALGVNARPLDPNLGLASAEWKAGQMSNDLQNVTWDVSSSIPAAGNYQIKFLYTSGGHRLDIHGIEILVNGTVVANDPHYGRTGNSHVDNVFKVNVKSVPSGAKVELRAKIRGDGGGDSNGNIWISRG